jgi:TonB family protein
MKKIIWLALLLIPSLLWANQNFETLSNHVVISETNRLSIYWIVQPQISQNDLKHIPVRDPQYDVIVIADVDQEGNIGQVQIIRSSGNQELDQIVLTSVKNAKVHNPYARPVRIKQPFSISTAKEDQEPKWQKWLKKHMI